MDIFQNQCSESLGFDSMLSSNHLNSPLHDSPGSPNNPLTSSYAPTSPYFSSISQQHPAPTGAHTSGPNDVILPSIFVKIPTQINQQYQQQESRLRSHHHQHSTAGNEIKCEERSDSIKSEIADTRVKLAGGSITTVPTDVCRLPDVIDNYLTEPIVEPAVEPTVRLCERCPFATLSEARLNDHRREAHPGGGGGGQSRPPERIHCPVCANKFHKAAVLELHLSEDHEMTASEVELLSGRIANQTTTQPVGMVERQCGTATEIGSEPIGASYGEIAPTYAVAPATNHSKSRIYIKNVQLLKKPDVIAQETRHESRTVAAQTGSQGSLLSTDQEPSTVVHGTLHESHQLSLGEDMLPPLDHALDPCAINGNKIFIRSVSLLQNVNFVASGENMLTNGNGGNRYGTEPPHPPSYLSMDCASEGTTSLLGGYGTMDEPAPPPPPSAQSRGSRIYIKNVDILRNPLIGLEGSAVPSTSALPTATFNEPCTTSRASSCESIICTSTPPATAVEQQHPPAAMPGDSASSMENNTLGSVSQTGDQTLLHGTEISYTVGTEALGGANRTLPLTVDQGSQNLLMLFSTSLDPSAAGAVNDPNVSYSLQNSNSYVQSAGYEAHHPTVSAAPGEVQQHPVAHQQPQRKSKIFIKNISVLKQPTIHLKSVDEVNLMTYDELQNILPPVGGGSSQAPAGDGAIQGTGGTTGPLEQLETRELLIHEHPMDKSFNEIIEINEKHPSVSQELANDDDGDDGGDDTAMEGYHESEELGYGELPDVCDFTEGFNDRDDPGGGGIHMTAAGIISTEQQDANSVADPSTHGGDVALPASARFPGEIILLQEESDANEKISPNHGWDDTIEAGPTLGADILQPPAAHGMEMSGCNEPGGGMRGREEDHLLTTHHVINLDPPNEYQPAGGDGAVLPDVNPSTPKEQVTESLTPEEETVQPPPPVSVTRTPDRPRARGRPKGAKQTGITKLKKLYTNLTVEEAGYKCDLKDCGVRFRQPDKLEYHRQCHAAGDDAPGAIQCPACGSLEFRNWNTLHTHLWREHEIDMELYACHLCSFRTPVLCRLNNTHMKIHSEERNFKCAICAKAFKNNKQLRNHRRWHRDPQQQQQQQQEVPVLEEAQPITQPVVEETSAAVPTSKEQPSAERQKNVNIKCVRCGLRFAGKRQLRTHMDSKHPAEADGQSTEVSASKHRCLLCGMVFKTRYLLQSHAAKHSDEKRFKCEHCDYTTNDHNAFRRHKMRHSTKGGHMYKCSYCDYSSIQSTTYRKHLERMHAEVASALLYKCAKCPFVSISEAKYQLHKSKHHGDDDGDDGSNGQGREAPEPVDEADDSERQQRQCESVSSDVVIVEQRDITPDGLGASPMDVELMEDSTATIVAGVGGAGGLQIMQQHPIIRPAMFANNFSKVDNFYGYQPAHPHGQPMLAKLPDTGPRGMCPSSAPTSCPIGILPTPVAAASQCPVPVAAGQLAEQQQQQHEYTVLANATADVLMREQLLN